MVGYRNPGDSKDYFGDSHKYPGDLVCNKLYFFTCIQYGVCTYVVLVPFFTCIQYGVCTYVVLVPFLMYTIWSIYLCSVGAFFNVYNMEYVPM